METTQLLIDISVNADNAIKAAGEQTNAIAKLHEENNKLKADQKEARKEGKDNTAAYEATGQQIAANEAKLKTLSTALNNNQKVQKLLTTETKDATGAYQLLQNQYSVAAQRAKDLTVTYGANNVEAKKATAAAKEMSDKLKEVDASVGQNQRNVGNYSSVLGMLPGKFGALAGGVDKANLSMMKLALNPIGAIIAAVGVVVVALVAAFKSNGAAVEKMNQVMAPLNTLFQGFMAVLGKVVEKLVDGVMAVVNFINAIGAFITGQDKANTTVQKAINLEKERQLIAEQERADIVDDAKLRERVGELKKTLGQKDKFTAEQRLANAREIDRLENANMLDDMNRQIRRHNNLLAQYKAEGKAYKDLTVEQKDEVRKSEADIYNIKAEYFEKTKRSASTEAKTAAEIEAEKKAIQEKAQSDREKRRDAEIKKMEINLQIALAKEKEITSQVAYDTWIAEKEILDKKVKYGKVTAEEAQLAQLQSNNKYRDQITENAKTALEAEKKRMDDIIAYELAYYDEEAAISTAESDKIVEQNKVTAAKELEAKQMQLDNEYYMAEGDMNRQLELTKEKLELQKAIEITAADGNASLISAINEKYRQLDLEATAATQQKKQQAFLDWANKGAEIAGNLNNLLGAIGQADLARYEKENKGKVGFEEAYAKKKAKLEHDAAVRAKAISVMTTIISTAQSIMAALAIPLGAGVPLAIANAAAGAIQLATIVATPIPGGGGAGGGGGGNAPTAPNVGSSNPTSVAGSLAARSVPSNPTTQIDQGMSNALAKNPIQQVLVIDDVTTAIARKTAIKDSNAL